MTLNKKQRALIIGNNKAIRKNAILINNIERLFNKLLKNYIHRRR